MNSPSHARATTTPVACRAPVLFVLSLIVLQIAAGARAVRASSLTTTFRAFGVPSAEFASALAIGDAGILVGASRDDAGAGAAYVFDFDAASGSGTLRRKIPNPSPHADDRFGSSVAVVGTDFVVGAPGQ